MTARTRGQVGFGRTAPVRLTLRPSSEFTSVDLPDPVEPPTTINSGASVPCRGRTSSADGAAHAAHQYGSPGASPPGIARGTRPRAGCLHRRERHSVRHFRLEGIYPLRDHPPGWWISFSAAAADVHVRFTSPPGENHTNGMPRLSANLICLPNPRGARCNVRGIPRARSTAATLRNACYAGHR